MKPTIGIQSLLVRFLRRFILIFAFFLSLLAAKNLIDQLLVVDRFRRIRAEDILVHPWILTVGQSKTIRHTEELKTTLRTNYEAKMKEYATENIAAY